MEGRGGEGTKEEGGREEGREGRLSPLKFKPGFALVGQVGGM